MNSFEKPTSMENIQESNLLKASDKYKYQCELNVSQESLKTKGTATIQNIDFLFDQIQKEDADVEAIVNEIYSLSLDIVLKPSINKYFNDNFPFLQFSHIVFECPELNCYSIAFICFASASQSEQFPYQEFNNENALAFLCQALTSNDPTIVDSSLQVLTSITKKSIDSRDFLLQNDIISTLKSLKLTFSVAELLESLCSLNPPPDAQFIPAIADFISTLIEFYELSISELGLSSLLSLLTNNAEGIDADQFQDKFTTIFYSESTSLVSIALQIMMFSQNPQPNFPLFLLSVLEGDDFQDLSNNLTVLLLIAQLFAHFEPIWRPIVQDRPFLLLESRIGFSNFKTDIEIIQTMILYYDNSHVNDMKFFNILLRFSGSVEIGCKCMEQILMMIQTQQKGEIFDEMMNQLHQSEQAFVDLAAGDDDDMVEHAEAILNQLNSTN